MFKYTSHHKIGQMKKHELIVLIFFIAGFVLRINSLGILDYPGNIKSCDATNYYLLINHIASNSTFLFPGFMAYGQQDVPIVHPPIFLLINSALFSLSNLEGWNILVFVSLLINSLIIIIMYYITTLIFNSEDAGLIASALYVLPANINVWIWPWYIGMFIQGLGFTLVFFSIYLWLSEFEKPSVRGFLLLLITLTGIFLAHFSDLLLVLPLILVLIAAKQKFIKKNILSFATAGLILLVPVTFMSPDLLPGLDLIRFILVFRDHCQRIFTSHLLCYT
jgi:hypothetical protein